MKNKNVKEKKKEKKLGLTTKIFIALILGAVFGIVLCYLIPDSKIKHDIIVEGVLYVIGQGFIRLMKMLVVPLVFCSLVCGSMAIGDTKKLGTVGVRTLIFYLATTALAVTVALSIGNLINPGIGLDMSAIQTSASTVETMEATSLTDTILNNEPFTSTYNNAFKERSYEYFYSLYDGNELVMNKLDSIFCSDCEIEEKMKLGFEYLKKYYDNK